MAKKKSDKPVEYILSLSYGKDSLACLGAIEELGWPLDRIVHAEVWATDTIPADLPQMVLSCASSLVSVPLPSQTPERPAAAPLPASAGSRRDITFFSPFVTPPFQI